MTAPDDGTGELAAVVEFTDAATGGLVVIGSGAAGISAAVGYRDAGGTGPVTVLSADVDQPYERPPLSKDFLQGHSAAADALLHQDGFYAGKGIELRLNDPVTDLDVDARTVTTATGAVLGFTSCVLATGSTPIRLPVPGADLPAVHLLRSMADARALRAAAEAAHRAVVVGSGFIGCEAAASLARRGVAVTMISPETLPQVNRLGDDVGQRLASWLRSETVELRLGESLAQITSSDAVTTVHTDAGRTIRADLVVMAGGVRPNVTLADAAGLEMAEGRVRVDERMQTSAAGIYAAGDIAYAYNGSAGRHLSVEHWGEALTMGEIAGRNAAGSEASWTNAPGFWSTIGDRTLKYAAWGDGFDRSTTQEHDGDAFTVWYARQGRVAGVLTFDADDDYDAGTQQVEQAAPSTL